MKASLTIEYCSQCRFLLRANWMAQECLTTFPDELYQVCLKPGSSGVFDIYINDLLIFSKGNSGRFPESSELKQMIRDRIAPGKSLGHSDTKDSDKAV